jgi:hypothetical protein
MCDFVHHEVVFPSYAQLAMGTMLFCPNVKAMSGRARPGWRHFETLSFDIFSVFS